LGRLVSYQVAIGKDKNKEISCISFNLYDVSNIIEDKKTKTRNIFLEADTNTPIHFFPEIDDGTIELERLIREIEEEGEGWKDDLLDTGEENDDGEEWKEEL